MIRSERILKMKVGMTVKTVYKAEVSVLLILTLLFLFSMADECKQKDSCTCESQHGSINLHHIANHDNSARFSGIKETAAIHKSHVNVNKWLTHGPEFYYNPCIPFNIGPANSSCNNVALCKYHSTGEVFEDIGEQTTAKFGYDEKREQFFIKYSLKDTSIHNISSTVYLQCDKQNEFNVLESTTSTFVLLSPCACYNGCGGNAMLSVGTILCMVFFSCLLTYLVIGVLYKKAVYGSKGLDLIPNTQVWIFLAELVKDGYLFFISPCLNESVEYRRYERL